nr:hypothetical protein [Xanthomonas citri]
MTDLGACRRGDRCGGIAGIVVQHMNHRTRQSGRKIADDRSDSRRFVVARHQHGDSNPGHRRGMGNRHGIGHRVL